MQGRSQSRIAAVLAWGTVATLLMLTVWLGNLAAYVALLGSVLGLLLTWNGAAYREVLSSAGMTMLIAAFVLSSVAMVAGPHGHEDWKQIATFIPLLLAVPAAALFSQARTPRAPLAIAVMALAGAAMALAVSAYQGFALDLDRPRGYQNSPIHFGDLAVILGFMALSGVIAPTRPRWRAIFLAGPALGIVAAVLAGTRASIFVAIVLLPFALYYLIQHSGWRRRTVISALTLGLIGAGGVLVAIGGDKLTRAIGSFGILGDMFSGGAIADDSFRFRLDMWQAGLRAFLDAPFFGHGWSRQFEGALKYMSPDGQATYQVEHWAYIHNEALSFAAGLGVFGLMAWVLIIAHPLVLLRAAPKDSQATLRTYLCLIVMMGVFVSGLTDVLFKAELFRFFFWFMPAAIVFLCRDPAIER